MRPPIQRIDSYSHPVSGTVAFDVLSLVRSELLSKLPYLSEDPVFEVSSEPRGTYTGVTVFVQAKNVDNVVIASKEIEEQLESTGYRALIAVRSWTT